MTRLPALARAIATAFDRALSPVLPVLARIVFAAVLLGYFWASAATKLGDGVFGLLNPTSGAFVQIFPRAMEAAGYDAGQLGLLRRLIVIAGTCAEFVLPLLIVIGLLTRLAAFGMIGFVLVQSATDIVGHGAEPGQWFDRASDAAILDQRAFWLFLLLFLLAKGAGPLSMDRLILRA